MNIDQAINEWKSKTRRMGCVSASSWFCKRVSGFQPERLIRYNQKGECFSHVVATNGMIRIDLSPYADISRK